MKRILPFLLIFSTLHAQKQRPAAWFVDSILNNRTLKIPVYNLAVAGNESRLLTMPFGKSDFLDTVGISFLQDAEILSIDLVFTDYPAKLDLKPLNRSRFLALIKLLPNSRQSPYTQWQVFRQMDGFDKESAKGMVHGFVINYRPKPTRAETRKELTLLKAITPEEIVIVPEPKKEEPKKKINHWEIIHRSGRTKYLFYKERQIKSIGPDKNIVSKELESKDSLFSLTITEAKQMKLIEQKDNEKYKGKDSAYVLLYPLPEPDTFLIRRMYKPRVLFQKDTSVISMFKRNRFKNMLMVADVTGSMSPYTSQIIQWLSDEANQKNIRSLVCFNDGDGKQTEVKLIGNTGGIYGEPYNNPIQISELIQRVMEKGSGGDTPENVCEALIKAIAMYKDFEDVVLIADSWAPVRDIELASQISRPIKIIACGDFAPHADYVDIAYKTGGSIHTTTEDITGLSILANGKELTIRGRNYKLVNGRVVVAVR